MNISPAVWPTSCQQPVSQPKARGFSLTELVIVLAIIGLVLSTIWVAASQVYNNNRTKTATTEILAIFNNWKTVYGGKRVDVAADGTDITAATIANNFAPSDMVSPAATPPLIGPWLGNTVTVSGYVSKNGIMITSSGLSQTACDQLANAVINSNLVYFNINGTNSGYLPPLGTTALPTLSAINTACKAAGGSSVQVMYPM